jgi:hypothetical protein
MKTSLWLVIVVVALFLGFLIGYSLAPAPPSAPAPAGTAR